MKIGIGSLPALATAFAVSSAFAAAPVETPTAIEEIVVTGEIRSGDLDRLPASIGVVGEREIRARNANHLEEILPLVPNVNFASGTSRARYIQIRGIGERGQFAEPLNSSVGLLIDGVDLSGIGTVGTLFDVRQVEVFRGPQGTRYGANALAGLVNVTTNEPTEELETAVQLEAGNYDTWAIGGVVSGPVSERLGYRLAAHQLRSDGFIENDFLGRDDTNERDELTLRGKLHFDVNDATTVDLTGGWIDMDNGYDAFTLDNGRTTLSDEPGNDRQETLLGSVRASFEGLDSITVETLVSVADSDIDYGYDEDWTFVGFHPDGYSSTDRYLRDRRTWTGEVRLLSKPQSRIFGGSTGWAVGVYGLTQDEDLRREYTFLDAPFESRFETDRVAVFGQLETELDELTTLTSGLRLERHTSEYQDLEGVSFDPEDDLWGARLALDRLVGEDLLAYASVARGYKAGGFNTDGTLDADLREFDPEVLYNYEVGLKGSLAEDRLTARVSLFFMQRDDVQISSSVVRVREDGSAEFIDYVGNAAEGINYGIEGEIEWRPDARTSVFAALGLLESEYERFVSSRGEDLDGREQAHAPGYQFAAGAQYRWPTGWFVRVEAEGKDEFFFSDSESFRSDAYELLHVSAGLARDDWSVKLWARNVTDEDYFVRGYFFGNDPRLDYAEAAYTQLGEPRRVGITLDWSM